MIRAIAFFELRYQLRRPSVWLVFAVFFVLGLMAASTAGGIGTAAGQLHRNAPLAIARAVSLMSLYGLVLITVFVADAALRDFAQRTAELVFCRPVPRLSYLAGRFLGAWAVAVVLFLGVVLGLGLAVFMPWVDPQQLGPVAAGPYLWAVGVVALPNLFVGAAIFFMVASLTRSLVSTYVGLVGSLVAYLVSQLMVADLESRYLAALIDPFGQAALQEAARYWSVVEKNTLVPELAGLLLHNRLLWTAVALAALALVAVRFRGEVAGDRTRPRPAAAPPGAARRELAVERRFTFATLLRQLRTRTVFEVRGVVRSLPFQVLLTLSIPFLVAPIFLDMRFGTPEYPLTVRMLAAIAETSPLVLLVIVGFYAGELIWRERSVGIDGIVDASPAASVVFLGGKLAALWVVVIAFLSVQGLAAVGFQAAAGYYRFEPWLYLRGLVVVALPFVWISVLAAFLHVVSSHKLVGHLLMLVYVTSYLALDRLGFEHRLYHFGRTPEAPYSDMNGYGHFIAPLVAFNVYWAFAATILAVLAVLFWVRGTERSAAVRMRLVHQRWRGGLRRTLAAAVVGFIATGSWIYYNTNVLNPYLPQSRIDARQAEYEKKYRRYKDVALPRVREVSVSVDLFPAERRVEARGRYLLENHNAAPLVDLHLTIPPRVAVNALALAPHRVAFHDPDDGYRILRLERPLDPGATMELGFDLTIRNPGFVNNAPDAAILRNGTFFDSRRYFPTFGYNVGRELTDPARRRRYGLPPVHPLAPVDDLVARRNSYVSNDADLIRFETTVSTSADQIALAPGRLVREWTADGRRYFHYRPEVPIRHDYSYLSAAYQVVRDRWRDVAIEVYFHPAHGYNVASVVAGVKKSLAYNTEHFGPYPFAQLRLAEFPRYRTFGASAGGDLVALSAAIGFLARVDGDDAINGPFFLTAHEIAHHWWGRQVAPGDVQGATVLLETLAQYSALMVMEHEFGRQTMGRFLRYELDLYLRGRSADPLGEVPLVRVGYQPFLHYRKGSLVMYALRDALGEEALNEALGRFAARFRYQGPPYPTTRELLGYFRAAAGREHQRLVTELFETITLYDIRVEEATGALRDGRYAVTLRVRARKLRADAEGRETEVPIDDWIDLVVFGKDEDGGEKVLHLEKRRITAPETTFVLMVDERPLRAGIDPWYKLIDRSPGDNVKRVDHPMPPWR